MDVACFLDHLAYLFVSRVIMILVSVFLLRLGLGFFLDLFNFSVCFVCGTTTIVSSLLNFFIITTLQSFLKLNLLDF